MLTVLHHSEDPQCRMIDAEIMTTALVAVMYFGGKYTSAYGILQEQGHIPDISSASRFNRRSLRIRELFLTLFALLGEHWKALNAESIYSIDSFPIAVCDNIRIPRARIYQDERYRGYCAGKKCYFYDLKLHLLVSQDDLPSKCS